MHELTGWRRLAAIGSTAALLVGCGIAGQSPSVAPSGTPGSTAAVSTPTQAATGTPSTTGTPDATASVDATASPAETGTPEPSGPPPSPAGEVDWANWPLYIDIDEETGEYPTLEKFTSETGIAVNYQEAINDNEEFFGRIQPDLQAGNPTGWDSIVLTDWMVERMIRLDYAEELDYSQLPNVTENLQPFFTDQYYDPGNRYSLPWAGGFVGIGYNPTLTGREITTFDDLLDPAFAGRVGLFSDMRDTMSLTLLSNGVVPEEATIDDVAAARDKLLEAAERGQFRAFYGNDYYDALAAGDLAITIAWSGDISQMKLYDNPDVEFVIPDTGAMFFIDNFMIPKAAEHPVDAHALMNFWYDTENAAALTEYVGYYSPVAGVRELILQHSDEARAEGDEEWADQLLVIADTSYPTDEQLENVYFYKVLAEDEERQWNDMFNEVVSG
jgi:spermidine/putrescine transport system substrate-binding protein